ncbi:cation diffusion facilitator family transporter [Methanobrevibacter sp.]|uniref:cation diffusion facilitator family transporter n=1 Tax=Methanobrevibacter sp. TaxID=66852 RepID=UPI00388E8CA5
MGIFLREQNRDKLGKRASIVEIASICVLTVLNIVVGLMGGSYALVAEGMHTLTDIVTSVIAYVGFKISQRPADESFPEGYGRAEAIAGLIIVIVLTFISFEIMDMAHHKLENISAIVPPDNYVVLMAIVGIVLNFIISRYVIKIGREINSPAIEADGQHQRTDIYTSIAILAGVVVSKMGFPMLDPIIGFIIGLLILKTAYEIGRKNILNIMGFVPNKDEFLSKINGIVDDTPNASNAHNIKVDNFASYLTVTLHVDVDANLTVEEAYEISNQVERNILELPEIRYVCVKPCPDNECQDKE